MTFLNNYHKTKYKEMERLVHKYRKNLHRLAKYSNHLIFNLRCKNAKLIQRSLLIQPALPARENPRYPLPENRTTDQTQRDQAVLAEKLTDEDFKKVMQICEEAREDLPGGAPGAG